MMRMVLAGILIARFGQGQVLHVVQKQSGRVGGGAQPPPHLHNMDEDENV